MAKRYFNWKLAIVLLLGLAVTMVTAYGLHKWQRSGGAEKGLELGNKAYQEQRWDQAAINLGRYIAVETRDITALMKYADAQLNRRPMQNNNIQQAIAAYRNILRIEKGNKDASMRLADLYLSMRMPGEAELIAQRGVDINNDPQLREKLAMSFIEQREYKQALQELIDIVQSNPEQISVYNTLFKLTEQHPDLSSEPSSVWVEKVVNNNPSSAMAYVVRANYHLLKEDLQSALSDLNQAEKQDLPDPQAHLALAVAFFKAKLFDKAEKHLTALYVIEPKNRALWFIWADIARLSGSKEKMVQIAQTGLNELSSDPWDFMLTAIELYIRSQETVKATECISRLRQKDIASPTIDFYEGLVAELSKDYYEAIKCWNRTIQLGNKSPKVRLALASVYSRLGDSQSALHQLRALVLASPNSFAANLAFAKLLARMGNWDQAADIAAKALELSPNDQEASLLFAQTQMQKQIQNSKDKTPQSWKKIENQLSMLDETTSNTLGVKLLRLGLAMEKGDLSSAGNLIDKLKSEHPDDKRSFMAEIELLAAENKTDDVISKLNIVIEKFPTAIEPVTYLAVLSYQQDDQEKCEAVIMDALMRIDEPVIQRRLGILLSQLYGRWKQDDKAYQMLNSLTKKLPRDIPLKRQLLISRQVTEDHTRAQQLIDEIKSIEGEGGYQWRIEQARLWLSDKDNLSDRKPQLITLLKENIFVDPYDQASRLLLASTYENTGEDQLALSTWRQALDRSPQDIRIIVPVVSALYRAKEYDEAEKILNRAAAKQLIHPGLQRLQLQNYLRHGDLDSASSIMDNFIDRNPDDKQAMLSLAILKMVQNKLDESENLLNDLRSRDPDSMPVITVLAQLKFRQDKGSEAIDLCNEAVRNLNNADAYILRARTFTSLEQNEQAIKDLDHIVKIESENFRVWLARSDFYQTTGQMDRATEDISKAITLAPENLEVQRRAIVLFSKSQDPKVAAMGIQLLDKSLKSTPEDIDLNLLKARQLIAERIPESIENAAEVLDRLLQLNPENTEARLILSNLYLSREQSAKALDIALHGLVLKPGNRALLLRKAQIEAMRSPLLAIPTLRALHESKPEDMPTTFRLADLYIAADQTQKAVDLLKGLISVDKDEKALQKYNMAIAIALYKNDQKTESKELFGTLFKSHPTDTVVLQAYSSVLKDDAKYSDVTEKVTEWFSQNPDSPDGIINIAQTVLVIPDQNARKEGENMLKMVLDKFPDHKDARLSFAVLLQMTERYDEAGEHYQKVIELQPDNVVAMNNLAWIKCEEQGRFEEALELVETGLKFQPAYADLIDTRGVTYYRMGKFEKAIEDFNLCIKLYPSKAPESVSTNFHLVRALVSIGQNTQAFQMITNILEQREKVGGLAQDDMTELLNLRNSILSSN